MQRASSFFQRQSDGTFNGTDAARGPWSVDHCHGGPVAGLAARAVEQLFPNDLALTRLTIDLLRPVPMMGLRVVAQIDRQGRNTAAASVQIFGEDDKLCVSGTSLHLSVRDVGKLPTAPVEPPSLQEAVAVDNFLVPPTDGPLTFGHHVEVKLDPNTGRKPGPKRIWMRTPAIVEGEDPSPFQTLCPLGDCGNGISSNASLKQATFLNPDLTIVMHRVPQGEWLSSDALSHWQSTGIGMAQAIISDEGGPVATALQTLLVQPR